MPTAPHAQRMNVLGRANAHGWTHDMALYDDGNIIRDEFTSEIGIVRAVWLRTPWSDSGRWTGSRLRHSLSTPRRSSFNKLMYSWRTWLPNR